MKNLRYYKKTKLYGAGHPQLPFDLFAVYGSKKNIDEFWEKHETTHARFEMVDGRKLSKFDREDCCKYNADL